MQWNRNLVITARWVVLMGLFTAPFMAAPRVSLATRTVPHVAQAAGYWERTAIANADSTNGGIALALDTNDAAHVAYINISNTLVYATNSSGVWVTETVFTSAVGTPSIALNAAGEPRIAFTKPQPAVLYAARGSSVWITDTVDDVIAVAPTIKIDKFNVIHIAYQDARPTPPTGPGEGIRYAWSTDGDTWNRSVIDPDVKGCQSNCDPVFMALGSNSRPRVVYRDPGSGNLLKFAEYNGSNWQHQSVTAPGIAPSLALDKVNQPHIAYLLPSPRIFYTTLTNSVWISSQASAEVGTYSSLKLSSFDAPNITYCDPRPMPPNAPGEGVEYAYQDGGQWKVKHVHAVACGAVSLALDSSDNPHIAYYNATDKAMVYARWRANSVTNTIPAGGGTLQVNSENTMYTFDSGTFSEPVMITHTALFAGAIPPTGNLNTAGHQYEITATATTSTRAPALLEPGRTYTVNIGYNDIERGLIDESTLALYYWDGNAWVKEPTSSVNVAANTIIATPNHFSVWAVLGRPRRIYMPLLMN